MATGKVGSVKFEAPLMGDNYIDSGSVQPWLSRFASFAIIHEVSSRFWIRRQLHGPAKYALISCRNLFH